MYNEWYQVHLVARINYGLVSTLTVTGAGSETILGSALMEPEALL